MKLFYLIVSFDFDLYIINVYNKKINKNIMRIKNVIDLNNFYFNY